MKTVPIHQAKTHLSRLIKEACQGKEIIIMRGSVPAVRLVPVNPIQGDRKPGALRGKLHVGPEFFDPLPPEEFGEI